jgi:alpha-mannosidase
LRKRVTWCATVRRSIITTANNGVRETLAFEAYATEGGVVHLRGARLAPSDSLRSLRYATRTGALLRIDAVVRGAFDGEHSEIALPGDAAGDVTLAVEERSLPTRGMPPGDGWRWQLMLARAAQTPERKAFAGRAAPFARGAPSATPLALVGHSHLDVAWLWTYEEAARKALRTFATAVRQLELVPSFVYTQSQPQLYAFVREREPELFERIAALARTGRLDATGAALWVEPDCNLPSGESLLRQLAAGCDYAERELGTQASVAWLPDSFGFPNTLPTLLRHAGVSAFGTTKLAWNDTTKFPHAQFVWEGPDGSRVVAAQIDSIAGAFARRRVRRARARGDLLLIGEGDGGGGAPDSALRDAPAYGTWTTLGAWFAALAEREAALSVVRDELYLEEHRGTLTTHHDVKARNAALERALRDAEETLAWAHALHATPFFLDEARRQLAHAWEIVMRAQFHDVLPGTAIPAVYTDVFAQYDEADALVAHVGASARSVLPVAAKRSERPLAPPRAERGAFVFENEALVARVDRTGTIVELHVPGGPNLVRRAQRLALYADRPKRWDAWNVDRSYRTKRRHLRATACELTDDGLEVRFAFGSSLAVARFTLAEHEPFLRVDLAVAWHERHALLRVENALRFKAARARFGSPHGSVDRAPAPRTAAERAKYEAAGQRFGRADRAQGGGLALLALDTYGWNVATEAGGTHLGHSLLRAPLWPDPTADRGEHAFSLAYAPFGELGMGELELLWERFAREPSVAMFVSSDARVVVVATKLAADGTGVIVRARECDGTALEVRLACGARALAVASVDARERPVALEADLHEGAIVARFGPYEMRSFRVRLR